MPRSSGRYKQTLTKRQSTGFRPLIAFCVISLLVLTFYLREGSTGPFHTLRAGVTTITYPLRMVGSAVATPFNALGNIAGNLTASEETLADLKAQNEELTAQVAALTEAQETADRLNKLLDLQDTYKLESVAARIIGTTGDAWTQTVTIDKGSLNGFDVNMPVTNSSGVIGQIIEVSPTSSVVRLINDDSSGVSALVQSSRAQGMLEGQPDGSLRLNYVPSDAQVEVGDIVVTSGIGGVYPKGLPLGRVSSVEKLDNDLYYTIVVEAASSVENQEEVLVITSLTEEQTATSEDIEAANDNPEGEGAASEESSDSSDESGDGTDDSADGSTDEGTGDDEYSDEEYYDDTYYDESYDEEVS